MAKTFDRDSLQAEDVKSALKPYRKTTVTMIMRVDGPFTVKTREGEVTCPDGYLAVDSKGWPYPVAADEFETIYEPADEQNAEEQGPEETQPEERTMNAQELQIRRKAASLELEAYEKLAEAQRLLESCGQPNAAMMAGGPSVGPAVVVSPEAALPKAAPQGAVTLVMTASEKVASLELLNKVASELHASSDPEMKKLSAEVDKIASDLDKVAYVYESDTKDPELEMHQAFKGGVHDSDKDEPYVKGNFGDMHHEVAQAIKDKRVYAPVQK